MWIVSKYFGIILLDRGTGSGLCVCACMCTYLFMEVGRYRCE